MVWLSTTTIIKLITSKFPNLASVSQINSLIWYTHLSFYLHYSITGIIFTSSRYWWLLVNLLYNIHFIWKLTSLQTNCFLLYQKILIAFKYEKRMNYNVLISSYPLPIGWIIRGLHWVQNPRPLMDEVDT
jgi:hypothetical protein